MKTTLGLIMVLIFCSAYFGIQAQDVAAPTGQQTLAATMKVYVFPTAGQAPEQQSQDEAACYSWAVQNTSSDPFSLQQQAQQQQQQSAAQKEQAQSVGAGAGAAGAVRGAAVGALIGGIAGDAGEGAAYGAAAGLIRGRRSGRAARGQAEQSAAEQARSNEQATAQQMEGFKKAFAVCLEAKSYMVKW